MQWVGAGAGAGEAGIPGVGAQGAGGPGCVQVRYVGRRGACRIVLPAGRQARPYHPYFLAMRYLYDCKAVSLLSCSVTHASS